MGKIEAGIWKSASGKGRAHTKGRPLDDVAWAEVKDLLKGKSRNRDLLIEHLHLIQDKFRCVSTAHMRALAEEMGMSSAEVYEVASFYAHFDIMRDGEQPPPKLTIRVCDSLSCMMAGAGTLKKKLENGMKIIDLVIVSNLLASKSEVRKDILEKNNIECNVVHSNVDEDPVKDTLIAKGANPETISKNLAELKANKVSQINENRLVLGADSVIDLNGKLISIPSDRQDALRILKLLNGKKHYLISSICLSMNGVMVWNHTDKALLIMKEFSEQQLLTYLDKISDELS